MVLARASLITALAFTRFAALADPVAVPPAEQHSLAQFATANPTCRSWSDGCAVCQRMAAGDAFACSTPGIACQPASLVCREPPPAEHAH